MTSSILKIHCALKEFGFTESDIISVSRLKNQLHDKQFFKVKLANNKSIHVTMGTLDKNLLDKSIRFKEQLEDYACEPLFFNTFDGISVFGQEYFEGDSIELHFKDASVNDQILCETIDGISTLLNEKVVSSTNKLQRKEWDEFVLLFNSNPNFRENDLLFFNEEIFPHMVNLLEDLEPKKRITNGDLTAQNILIGKENTIKIIDCEYSSVTHFYNEDYARLYNFSAERFKKNNVIEELYSKLCPFIVLFSNLKQISLFERKDEKYIENVGYHLQNIIYILMSSIGVDVNDSLITKSFKNFIRASNSSLSQFRDYVSFSIHDKSSSAKIIDNQANKIQGMDKTIKTLEKKTRDLKREIKVLSETLDENKKEIDLKKSFLSREKIEHEISRNALIEKQDKINRIENSFSWQLTKPLRFLRRHLFGRFFISHSKIPKSFDPGKYLDLNPDLKVIFGNNLEDAKMHYLKHGFKEGRPYKGCSSAIFNRKDYVMWLSEHDTIDAAKMESFTQSYLLLSSKPLISVILPVYNPKIEFLKIAVDSVCHQIYQEWELCICDDSSTSPEVKEFLQKLIKTDSRIKVSFRKENGHISQCSNDALKLSRGKFITFLDQDDCLRPQSLLRLAETLQIRPHLFLIYTDEDKIDEKGKRFDHHFKTDWNPHLLLGQNYICHLVCISKKKIMEIDGFRDEVVGAQDWDLLLRLTEILKDSEIYHIPEILYHWRSHRNSTASKLSNKSYAIEGARLAIKNALKRRFTGAEAHLLCKKNNYWKINFNLPKRQPSVCLLIPTRDRLDLLKQCVGSILEKTDYDNYSITILDNQSEEDRTKKYFEEIQNISNVRVQSVPGDFNYSRVNNVGVQSSNSEIIGFVNNDIKCVEDTWLKEMVSHALRPRIGCVGAKLLYPNGTIQHAGVITGIGGVAGHAFKHFQPKESGYKHRLQLLQNYQAVTAACLLVRKSVFLESGGFNEKHLSVAFNDVDLCLKVQEKGYQNLWTPHAVLLHYESASRGREVTEAQKRRFKSEIDYMKQRWKKTLMNDPYYNLNLNLDKEDFSLSFPPRKVL